jgi:CSLREA domain-containing protein
LRSAPLALILLLATPVCAADFAVTVTLDAADANPGDAVCNDGTGACTLRAAIQTANAAAGPDRVILPAGLFLLTVKRNADSDVATGDLDVTSEITVIGDGNRSGCDGVDCTAIDAKKAKDRVFDVASGGNLRLENLAVRNGKAAKDDENPNQFDEQSGGCIRVNGPTGQLETDDVVVERCSSPDDGGCIALTDGSSADLLDTFLTACKAKDDGGGIETDEADLAAVRLSISACKSGDDGGAIETTGGTIVLLNVTLSGNRAKEGGALAVEEGTIAIVNNATLEGNKAPDSANLHNEDFVSQLVVSNSIVHSKKRNDCGGDGPISSAGHNLEGGTSCGFSVTGDEQNADPLLAKLGDNGGEVPTHAVLAGSPAIGAGDDASCETTDAREATRNGVCDAGAFELGGVLP